MPLPRASLKLPARRYPKRPKAPTPGPKAADPAEPPSPAEPALLCPALQPRWPLPLLLAAAASLGWRICFFFLLFLRCTLRSSAALALLCSKAGLLALSRAPTALEELSALSWPSNASGMQISRLLMLAPHLCLP